VALEHEVGIDVEDRERRVPVEELVDRCLAVAEAERLRRLPLGIQREAFLECWTLKEAYLKARGVGLSLPLTDVSFQLEFGQPPWLATPPIPPLPTEGWEDTGPGDDPSHWQFAQFRPAGRYLLALAVCSPPRHDLAVVVRDAAYLFENRR
jgi:4'-phosphopantetheinyl transferase